MQFEFATSQRIVFGRGSAAQAGALAKQFGRRAMVLTGNLPERISSILDFLKREGIECRTLPVAHEPEVSAIEEGVAQSRSFGCELVVAVGGGSVLDAGKAIAAMLANPGEIFDYLEVIGPGRPLERPSLPVVAVPTTAGTGSGVTRKAVISSPQH